MGRGGGFAVTGGGLTCLGGTVTGNSAETHGGGVAVLGGTMDVAAGEAGLTVANNTAVSGHGGGLYVVQVRGWAVRRERAAGGQAGVGKQEWASRSGQAGVG